MLCCFDSCFSLGKIYTGDNEIKILLIMDTQASLC